MSEERSTLSDFRDALSRTKNALKKTEAQVERATTAVVRWGVSQGAGFLAGAAHERFGKMDARAGVKILRIGGINIGILASVAGLGGELLEAAGNKSDVLGAAAGGIGGQAFGDQGRAFVRTLAQRKSERDAEKKREEAKAEEKKQETAAAATA